MNKHTRGYTDDIVKSDNMYSSYIYKLGLRKMGWRQRNVIKYSRKIEQYAIILYNIKYVMMRFDILCMYVRT